MTRAEGSGRPVKYRYELCKTPTQKVLVANSKPTVCTLCGMYLFLVKRMTRLDLPTPESPMRTTLRMDSVIGDDTGDEQRGTTISRRFATSMGAPLWAVQAHLSSYDEDVAQIQALIPNEDTEPGRSPTLSILIIKIYVLYISFNTLLLRQDTRWGSTDLLHDSPATIFRRMVERYFWLLEFLPDDDDETADILPSSRAVKRLKTLMVERTRVKNVNKALQKDGITMLDTRVWVDGLIEVEPSFKHYLADIVHSPDFEAGCVKMLNGRRQTSIALKRLLFSHLNGTAATFLRVR
ncbi:hypothetical protein F444_12293 [Phytophthora nicotianae P1976]|uniref:Uncharacterized protein n=1 Tax=Phytophthora nicotianae P1976 TaxID=1317066 RepID=A0A080ZXK2_PHYNI|nr:hypothetical protein F444_12293 [Phytophthora nicotianae P1976]